MRFEIRDEFASQSPESDFHNSRTPKLVLASPAPVRGGCFLSALRREVVRAPYVTSLGRNADLFGPMQIVWADVAESPPWQ